MRKFLVLESVTTCYPNTVGEYKLCTFFRVGRDNSPNDSQFMLNRERVVIPICRFNIACEGSITENPEYSLIGEKVDIVFNNVEAKSS